MSPRNRAWLNAHPERSATWLAEHIADGFELHHVDGNEKNNAPNNLVLIEGTDHNRLHRQSIKEPNLKEHRKIRGEGACETCGSPFPIKTAWARFCSTKCTRRAYRKRLKEEIARLRAQKT